MDPALAFPHVKDACIVDTDGDRYIDYRVALGPARRGHCHLEVNHRVAGTIERTGAGRVVC